MSSTTVVDTNAAERRAIKISLRLDTIADNYEAVMPMIREAIELGDHLTLGYRSPGDYLSDRFGKTLSRLPIGVRREAVGELTDAGLSTRAIGAVLDVSNYTVSKDRQALEAGVRSLTPESAPSAVTPGDAPSAPSAPERPTTPEAFEEKYGMRPDEADALISSGLVATREEFDAAAVDLADVDKETGEIHDRPVQKITGRDGKDYPRPEPRTASTPKRRPLADAARDVGLDLRKITERIERITGDDRFAANKNEVAAHLRHHLAYAIGVLTDLDNAINN